MRAPRRRRPRKRTMCVSPDRNLDCLAKRVRYVGSPEHKDFPSFAGPPRLRSDASCCPREIKDREVVCEWLRSAIRRGAVGHLGKETSPRYVWYKDGAVVFEGRLVNRGNGSYKGYPLDSEEWPDGIEEIYAEA